MWEPQYIVVAVFFGATLALLACDALWRMALSLYLLPRRVERLNVLLPGRVKYDGNSSLVWYYQGQKRQQAFRGVEELWEFVKFFQGFLQNHKPNIQLVNFLDAHFQDRWGSWREGKDGLAPLLWGVKEVLSLDDFGCFHHRKFIFDGYIIVRGEKGGLLCDFRPGQGIAPLRRWVLENSRNKEE